MRISPHRHPLAVLRTLLGKYQAEFGAMVGCSTATIQSIELGRLALSEDLAVRIMHETGVSVAWLLDGNPDAPILDNEGLPYSKEEFEKHRSSIDQWQPTATDYVGKLGPVFGRLCLDIYDLLIAGFERKEGALAYYRISQAIQPVLDKYEAGKGWKPEEIEWVSLQMISDIQNSLPEMIEQCRKARMRTPEERAQRRQTRMHIDARVYRTEAKLSSKELSPKTSKPRKASPKRGNVQKAS